MSRKKFQSTHPLRGATIGNPRSLQTTSGISIHAPLAGCDCESCAACVTHLDFNPRTPCGVRLHGAGTKLQIYCNFNPRTPCGVRLLA